MEVLTLAAAQAGVEWAWEKLKPKILEAGSKLAEKGAEKSAGAIGKKILNKWKKFNYSHAEEKYRAHLIKIVSKTKILGNPKPIDIESIYTDVLVYEKLSALQRFPETIEAMEAAFQLQGESRSRVSASKIAASGRNLYILGKPGAGKTTFLKHIAIQACKTKSLKTPIFISLKDWSDKNINLRKYVYSQFELCGFPEPDTFVDSLLLSGKAVVLLDGLDEITEWQQKRAFAIREVTNFVKRYPDLQICMTCRIAASDYSFEAFDYVEIADFTRAQQKKFIEQWYGDDNERLGRFSTEWRKEHQRPLREIGKTPLLLALICLAFDETLQFPTRQVDLYLEATEALLKKWDSSRNIHRDDFYKNLPPSRRENLLDRLAAEFYFDAKFVFKENELAAKVLDFLKQLPDARTSTREDAAAVVKAIEAQHGILVERAVGIYSFSHLTFQEFFTARYIIQNPSEKMFDQIVLKGLTERKWREVFLYTASLASSADGLCRRIIDTLSRIKDENTSKFLRSLAKTVRDEKSPIPELKSSRSLPLTVAELRKVTEHIGIMYRYVKTKSTIDYSDMKARTKVIVDLVTKNPQRAAELLGGYRANPEGFLAYLYACRMAVECLEVSITSKREDVVNSILV